MCYELHLWRAHAKFDPESSPSAIEQPNDLKIAKDTEADDDDIKEAITESFNVRASDLAYKLEALSLIELLPKVR